MGQESAELLQIISSASGRPSGIFASVLGVITLLVMASGVFGEMQLTLNATLEGGTEGRHGLPPASRRAASLGLVAALGFLLLVSLERYPL
jgi:membrane protein